MAIVTDGLVLYLHGACGKNNPATRVWKDLSGNGNDGQLVNFGYIEDSGWVDGGLKFDGVDDYVRAPNVLNMDGDFTVEIWAESDVYNTVRALFNTNARVSSPWNNKGFFITNIFNPLYLYLGINDGINGYVILGINNVSTFNNSHIVVKREGNMLYSFFNYARQNSLDISSYESFKTDNDITIARGYKGKVKVVRIYDRALSNEEILQNYQAGHEWTPQIGKREATTTMKPITTSLSRKGKGKRELISTMKPITTSVERKGKGKREVISTMKPITSSLSRKGVGRREVTTTIKPITSSISKKLPPIHANITAKERTPNITTRERIPKLEVD